jgi:hypothetical protein
MFCLGVVLFPNYYHGNLFLVVSWLGFVGENEE